MAQLENRARDLVSGGTVPISFSDGFAAVLEDLKACLVVSCYQAGEFFVIGCQDGHVWTTARKCSMPMGLAACADRLAVGVRGQVWVFRNVVAAAKAIEPPGRHDACFVPSTSYSTGAIFGHELGWAADELWIVNTKFSCLCTLDPVYHFVPRWRPPFVSELAGEDRCHLNGLAISDNRPRYATALGETDAREAWRAAKATGGVLIDVVSGCTVARGFAMPHSPRVHLGQVWLLDSGTGRLVTVDPANGHVEEVVQQLGFARGLGMAGHYGFMGLSKTRLQKVFHNLPVTENLSRLNCGMCAVDLERGEIVGTLEFDVTISEIFDIVILPHMRCPAIVEVDEPALSGMYVVPDGTLIVPQKRPPIDAGRLAARRAARMRA